MPSIIVCHCSDFGLYFENPLTIGLEYSFSSLALNKPTNAFYSVKMTKFLNINQTRHFVDRGNLKLNHRIFLAPIGNLENP